MVLIVSAALNVVGLLLLDACLWLLGLILCGDVLVVVVDYLFGYLCCLYCVCDFGWCLG